MRVNTLAVAAPLAPADGEGLQPFSTAPAAARGKFLLPPRTCGHAELVGAMRMPASALPHAAVMAATSGTAATSGHIKLVDGVAVPPGCPYSRESGDDMFNSVAGQFLTDRKTYQHYALVCIDESATIPTTPPPSPPSPPCLPASQCPTGSMCRPLPPPKCLRPTQCSGLRVPDRSSGGCSECWTGGGQLVEGGE